MITLEYALGYLRAPHVPCAHTSVCVARVVDALADVRTLDEWAEADCGTREWKMLPTNEDTCVFLRSGMSSEIVCFERGATPDEARAKAAAWVREQAKKGA